MHIEMHITHDTSEISLFSAEGNVYLEKYLMGQARALSSLSHTNVITLAGIHIRGNTVELWCLYWRYV